MLTTLECYIHIYRILILRNGTLSPDIKMILGLSTEFQFVATSRIMITMYVEYQLHAEGGRVGVFFDLDPMSTFIHLQNLQIDVRVRTFASNHSFCGAACVECLRWRQQLLCACTAHCCFPGMETHHSVGRVTCMYRSYNNGQQFERLFKGLPPPNSCVFDQKDIWHRHSCASVGLAYVPSCEKPAFDGITLPSSL
ncbi:hypothetical protein QR680_015337 [Steinernema hermaphroditum]|uniref:Uncharacterized protein n=1 Tax=Steinernema hermaphroditum TaxID=289476 RepID=A0AA39LKJ0_9BILA|nr:hypothetical protein QR680_015337 [Steinernema hermaphroditum]